MTIHPHARPSVTTSRGPLKTIRFAKGSDLLAWYEQLAEATEGLSTNGALIGALAKYRADADSGAAEPPREQSA